MGGGRRKMPPPKHQRDRMKRERLAMAREDKNAMGWFSHPVRALVQLQKRSSDASLLGAGSERFGPDDQWMRPSSQLSLRAASWMPSESSVIARRVCPESFAGLAPCYQLRDSSERASATAFPQMLSLPPMEAGMGAGVRPDDQLPSYRRVHYRAGRQAYVAMPYGHHHRAAERWRS